MESRKRQLRPYPFGLYPRPLPLLAHLSPPRLMFLGNPSLLLRYTVHRRSRRLHPRRNHPPVHLLQPSSMPQSVRPQCAYPMYPSQRHLHLGWALTLTDNGLLTEPANAAGKPTPSPSEWTAFQPTCLVPVRMLNTGDADSIPMGPTSLTMASLCRGLILNIRVTSNHTVHLDHRQARLRQSAHPVPPAQDAVAHQKRAS